MLMQHYNMKWLIEKLERGETLKFIYFWGHTNKNNEEVSKSCFSQWFESSFTVEGIRYKTAEHWMMAQKALLFGDKAIFEKVIHCNTPHEAKALGRKVLNYDEVIWENKRFELVKLGNIHKFSQNQSLGTYLLNTQDRILVEASPFDAIWGIGLAESSKDIGNIYAWKGLNLLGFVLMETRDYLKGVI